MIPKKILVCADFSENSIPARNLAVEYAKAFGAELAVLHVVNSRFIGYPEFASQFPEELAPVLDRIIEGALEELGAIATECSNEVDKVEVFSRTGSPAEEIVEFAKEESVGLIVMGTHGWTGARHLIVGSTAENVVRHAECPVLTVRSKA